MCQILLIEDHPNQRLLYLQELSDLGYDQILTASTGPLGLELFQLYRPTVTILDILLPGMDGIEVMDRILTIDSRSAIIVHSAFSSPSNDLVVGYAKSYVVKSGDLGELTRQVNRIFEEEPEPRLSHNWPI